MKLENLCINYSNRFSSNFVASFFCNTLDKEAFKKDVDNDLFSVANIIEMRSLCGYKSQYEVRLFVSDPKKVFHSDTFRAIETTVKNALDKQEASSIHVESPSTIDLYPNGKYSSKALTNLAKKCGISYAQVYAESRNRHRRIKLYYAQGNPIEFFHIIAKSLPGFQCAYEEKNPQWVGGYSIIIKINQ